jgi:microcystin-dependent protein
LGTKFGGDGRNTFALPDLRGRVPVGTGSNEELSPSDYPLGSIGGQSKIKLSFENLPPHSHDLNVNSHPGNSHNPRGNYLAANSEGINTYSDESNDVMKGVMANTGGGEPVSVMQPYLAVNFIIAIDGLYPPRQ